MHLEETIRLQAKIRQLGPPCFLEHSVNAGPMVTLSVGSRGFGVWGLGFRGQGLRVAGDNGHALGGSDTRRQKIGLRMPEKERERGQL